MLHSAITAGKTEPAKAYSSRLWLKRVQVAKSSALCEFPLPLKEPIFGALGSGSRSVGIIHWCTLSVGADSSVAHKRNALVLVASLGQWDCSVPKLRALGWRRVFWGKCWPAACSLYKRVSINIEVHWAILETPSLAKCIRRFSQHEFRIDHQWRFLANGHRQCSVRWPDLLPNELALETLETFSQGELKSA